jgi:2-polyprenyl-3-methyl-5-hydroxy-6-metoxy-1,4-benzoquinol methylase
VGKQILNPMRIDWYKHYLEKGKLVLTEENLKENLKQDRAFLKILRKFVPPSSKVLEAGCGLGRTCISMSLNGYKVTAVDIDGRMLRLAKKSAKNFSQKIIFKKFDFFNLSKRFKKNSFEVITHQGILEHYPVSKIRKAINIQLAVSPFIIFSIPINSKHNRKYFHDRLYRNLWNPDFWIKNILKKYKVTYHKVVRDRKDSLVIVIKRIYETQKP